MKKPVVRSPDGEHAGETKPAQVGRSHVEPEKHPQHRCCRPCRPKATGRQGQSQAQAIAGQAATDGRFELHGPPLYGTVA